MKVEHNGCKYRFGILPSQSIVFTEVSDQNGVLEMESVGVTEAQLLEAFIERMKFINKRMVCRENSIVITKCEEALMWLGKRERDMAKRNADSLEKNN